MPSSFLVNPHFHRFRRFDLPFDTPPRDIHFFHDLPSISGEWFVWQMFFSTAQVFPNEPFLLYYPLSWINTSLWISLHLSLSLYRRVASYDQINRRNYFTLSLHGCTHMVANDETEHISLERFETEYQTFVKLCTVSGHKSNECEDTNWPCGQSEMEIRSFATC